MSSRRIRDDYLYTYYDPLSIADRPLSTPSEHCETSSAPCLAVSSPGRTAPAPLATPACNGPGASWTWGARGTTPAAAMGRSASASLRPAADLNVDAIKEKLLDHRIPESCV